MTESTLVNILFTVIGFLIGLGAMSIWVMKRVDTLAVKMRAVEKDVERLDEKDDEMQRHIQSAIAIHGEAMKLVTKIVDQNNLLIQKIITSNGN
jgi:hypothetical protein